MTTLSCENKILDLREIVNNVICNNDETLIVSEKGSVVIIEQKDWKNIQETLNLLRDKKSLNALIESHRTRDEKGDTSYKSVKEAFHDLKN